MKKIITILLAITMVISLTACGSSSTTSSSAKEETTVATSEEVKEEASEVVESSVEEQTTVEESTVAEESTVEEAIEVLEGLIIDVNNNTVSLTLPKEFVDSDDEEPLTQEFLDADAEENGFISETLNEDGSVTIKLSKEMYDEMIDEMKVEFDEIVTDLVDEEMGITAATANEDYTEFTITCSDTELISMYAGFIDIYLEMAGVVYGMYTGYPSKHVTITYFDENGTELLVDEFEGTYADFMKSLEELYSEEE